MADVEFPRNLRRDLRDQPDAADWRRYRVVDYRQPPAAVDRRRGVHQKTMAPLPTLQPQSDPKRSGREAAAIAPAAYS